MKLMTSLVLLAALGGVHPQCFNEVDDFQGTPAATDLSFTMDFSVNLFKKLSKGSSSKGGVFFSPYSIWSALALAYFGSAGNTQRQLEETLKVSDKIYAIKLWRGLEQLYESRKQNQPQYTFDSANRAYVDNAFQLRPCFEAALKNEIQKLDFSDSISSSNAINGFVSETTKGLIEKVVDPGSITGAPMVLVNAAYFKGVWANQFEASNTLQRKFFINPRESVSVPMMSLKKRLRYGVSQSLGARVLELPYEGHTMSMVILLPFAEEPAETRFSSMLSRLNGAALRETLESHNVFNFVDVEVQLPKFKIEQEFNKELIQALRNMGITDLFDARVANMTDLSPYGGGLAVGDAVHKSFVEVNEEGTEAAAVTGLVFTYAILPNDVTFYCNEPFVYMIYDTQVKNILFMGAFEDPRLI